MKQDLRQEAREAVTGAAEQLGVDPFRLARFLSDGRLADILTSMRDEDQALPGTLDLAESYLDFLEREISLRKEPGPPSPRRTRP